MTLKLVFLTDGKGASRIQEAFVGAVKREFGDRVVFQTVDRHDEGYSDYSVEELPTIVIERDGAVEERFVGLTQERFLRKALERVLSGE